MQRYDTYQIEATKTDEGFIIDRPIIGRVGLLRYLNADGSERIEYRPPEEALNADSLKSIRGKPITLGHKAMVNSKNADKLPIVGTVLSEGVQDGENIRADVSIYSLPTAARELSCGYSLDLDETPGTTPDGKHYDAVQRNIRYNHLAIVPKGRAGNARLNMDGDQIIESEDKKHMAKVRLDNGLEYECAEEVKIELETLRNDKAKNKANFDALQGKYDALEAKANKLEKDLADEKANKNINFDNAVKERVEMLDIAKQHNLDKAETLSNKDIKVAVIKKVNGDNFNLDGKSDEYINGVFDICKEQSKNFNKNAGKVRQDINDGKSGSAGSQQKQNEDEWDYVALAEKMKQAEAKAYLGGMK